MKKTQNHKKASSYGEDLFSIFVESVHEFAIFAIDLEGNFVSWNPGVERLLGYPESEFVGLNGSIIFTPEDMAHGADRQEMETAAREARAEGKRWHVRKDGSRFWANALMTALRDGGGELYGFTKVMHDETVQKRAAEERDRFLAVGTNLLVITSLDGHFMWVSPAWERTFGWTTAELTEQSWQHFTHPDDHERTIREMEQLYTDQEYVSFENRYRSKDGSYHWLNWRTKPYPQEGLLYASAIDITERRQKELTLRFLVDLNHATQQITDPHEIMTTTALSLGEHLGVNRCAYAEVEADEDSFYITGDYIRDTISIVGQFQMSQFGAEVLQLMRAGKPYVVIDAETDARVTPDDLAAYRQTQISAVICVPLHKSGRFVAAMAVHQKTPRNWTQEEIELVHMVVNRCWESIERARAVRNLRESEERFRLFAQTATDAIIAIDTESRILFANKAAEDIFGYCITDMEGASLTMLMPDYLRRLHLAGTERYLRTGQKHVSWESVEVPGLHKDGREIPLDISFGEYNRGGKRYFTGICRDISERKRAQQRLDAQYLVTKILSESDTVTEATPRIIQIICESLGWDVGEVWKVYPDENHLRCVEAWHGPSVSDEVYADMCSQHPIHAGVGLPGRVWSSGEVAWISDVTLEQNFPRARAAERARLRSAFAFPIRLGGEVIGVMEFFSREVRERDEDVIEMISTLGSQIGQFIERRRVEKERTEILTREQEARAEAENANRLKDEFLATLSHELRTPLTAILGWARMLQTNNLEEATAKRALETIERSARTQTQLIEDLLDVSRIITGKLRLDVRAVDLGGIVTAAVDTLLPAAEAKSIRLQTLLDPQAGPVSGDPDRLQQVVWNLVSNAIKFTPKGGRVQVRLECVNSHVEITVSDTGAGISPEFLPHVFDRFRQANQKTTRTHGGLGLGLAIVHQLVELHGGTVHVESSGEDHGATFTVMLPLLPMRKEPTSDVPRVHPRAETGIAIDCPSELEGLRVLVVDDEEDTRELIFAVLGACGAQVVTAASAAEALEQVERGEFDVLVSDIGMPEDDGFSLIAKIRRLPADRGGRIPAAALTAYARSEDRVRAFRSGFQIHVPKPVEPAELISVVANLAGRIENA